MLRQPTRGKREARWADRAPGERIGWVSAAADILGTNEREVMEVR